MTPSIVFWSAVTKHVRELFALRPLEVDPELS